MSRATVPRLLATGSVVSAATAVRIGASCLGLLAARVPPLVRLAADSGAQRPGAAQAEAVLRDELVALGRELAEATWRELRRGVDDLDAFTRPDDDTTGDDTTADGPGRPHRRPYRVKP